MSIWSASTTNLQDGQFHHVAVTVDRNSNTGGKMYVDGEVVLTFDPTPESGDLSNTAPLYIGNHNNPELACTFKGIIDELSIYNRQLTSNEIKAIYQAAGAGKTLEPVAPFIIAQPASQQVAQGNNVTISVEAGGTQPLTYKWNYNGFYLSNETNSSLTVTNFRQINAGVYKVDISNTAGSIASSNAVLTLKPALAPQGLVGWWRGEGNVQDTASTAAGYETNGAGYGPGEVGTGFSLDGVDDRVIIPNAPALNFGSNQNFSVETWIQAQPTPGNNYGIAIIADKISRSDANNAAGWQLYLEYGHLGFQLIQGPISSENHWTSTGPDLQDGLFHHVAVTLDRTSSAGGKLYLDGDLVLTFDPSQKSGDLSSDVPLCIGNHGVLTLNCFFKGIIDEFSVYNREIAPSEIYAIYQSAAGGKSMAPVAPAIVAQPASLQVGQGNNVTIEVGVVGTQPYIYNWFFNGNNLTVTTNNLLTVSNFQSANEGTYKVVVSNGIGSATSSNAILTLASPVSAPQGLVGFWKGEGNVMDAVGNANGYETNGAGFGPAEVGTGFSLDGISNRVVVPNPASLNFGTNQDFSIEAWIQAQPTPTNYLGYTVIADKAYPRDASSVVGWMFYIVNGRLGFLMSQAPMTYGGSSYWESSSPDLQDGKFHHVAATVDRSSSTGGRLYVDGVVVLTFNPTTETGDLSNSAPLRIGNHNNPDFACNFKGIIDELSVYDRELTSAEITAIYQAVGAGKSVAPAAPVIISQPASQEIVQGGNVILEVGILGTQPLTYQWNFKGWVQIGRAHV